MHASSTLIFEFLSGGEATLVALLCEWFCESKFDFRFWSMIWFSKDICICICIIYIYIYIYLKWFKVSRCSILEIQICFGITLPIGIDLLICWWFPTLGLKIWFLRLVWRFEHFQIKVNFSKLRNFEWYKVFDKV